MQLSLRMVAFRVSFDMDPFVVVSFGKKVFRTRVIRHSLNPTWDEKLLFHVRRHESTFTVQFAVLDWDKVGPSVTKTKRLNRPHRSPVMTWSAHVLCPSPSC